MKERAREDTEREETVETDEYMKNATKNERCNREVSDWRDR